MTLLGTTATLAGTTSSHVLEVSSSMGSMEKQEDLLILMLYSFPFRHNQLLWKSVSKRDFIVIILYFQLHHSP